MNEIQKVDVELIDESQLVNGRKMSKGMVRRLIRYGKLEKAGEMLRGLGVMHTRVSSVAMYELMKRLQRNARSFSNFELSGISAYHSRIGSQILSTPSPEKEPEWDKLESF